MLTIFFLGELPVLRFLGVNKNKDGYYVINEGEPIAITCISKKKFEMVFLQENAYTVSIISIVVSIHFSLKCGLVRG